MSRIYFHWENLRKALNHAHDLEIISFPNDKYSEQAPCWALYELDTRIDKTTQKVLADTLQREIRNHY